MLFDTFGAEALSGGSRSPRCWPRSPSRGWAFIGFDSTVAAAEETKGAAKHVPRAVWIALLSVGALVILNAFATTLAHPNPADVAAGKDIDPVSTAVVVARSATGRASRSRRSCCSPSSPAAWPRRAATARGIYSVARDGVLPGSGFLRKRRPPPGADRRDRRGDVIAWAGLLLGLEATAIGSLITFGTAAIYWRSC